MACKDLLYNRPEFRKDVKNKKKKCIKKIVETTNRIVIKSVNTKTVKRKINDCENTKKSHTFYISFILNTHPQPERGCVHRDDKQKQLDT